MVGLLLVGLLAFLGVNLWAESQYRAAETALKAGELSKAQSHIDRTLQIWWRSASTHFLAARIYRLNDNYPEAEAHLTECKHLEGASTARTQLETYLLRAQNGELDAVEHDLWLLVTKQNHPESPMILETLARTYMRSMRFWPTLFALTRWLELEPNVVRALDWRAWTEERLHMRDQALADYQRVLELAPDRDFARLRLAAMLLTGTTPDPGAALPHLQYLRKTLPENADVWSYLGLVYFMRGELDDARHALDEALARDPKNASALLCLGKLEMQEHRLAQAEAHLRRAAKLFGASPEIHFALYDALRQQPGHKSEADAELARANHLKATAERLAVLLGKKADREEQDPNLACDIGILFIELERPDLGLPWMAEALRMDRTHQRTHTALAAYLEKTGEHEKAALHRKLAAQSKK